MSSSYPHFCHIFEVSLRWDPSLSQWRVISLQGGTEKHESETYETLLGQKRLGLHHSYRYTGPFWRGSTETTAFGGKVKKYRILSELLQITLSWRLKNLFFFMNSAEIE